VLRGKWLQVAAQVAASGCSSGCKWLPNGRQVAAKWSPSGCLSNWLPCGCQVVAKWPPSGCLSKWLQVADSSKIKMMHICSLSENKLKLPKSTSNFLKSTESHKISSKSLKIQFNALNSLLISKIH